MLLPVCLPSLIVPFTLALDRAPSAFSPAYSPSVQAIFAVANRNQI